MSTPTATSYPSSRAGKPINLNDQVTIIGQVTAVSGTGPTATLTVVLTGSGVQLTTIQAQDVAASGQTL
jgi:hypothetical protein